MKRYRLTGEATLDNNGEWVKYEHHVRAISQMQQDLRELAKVHDAQVKMLQREIARLQK